jgi:hypothetical protein
MLGWQNFLRGLIVVFALTNAVSGCVQFIHPLPPGSAVGDKPGHGTVLGRIALIRDGEDRMISLPSFPRSFGWELLDAESGRKYVMDPLTDDGLFAVALPAGVYHVTKLQYEDRAGLWEGNLPATFLVKPTGSTYLGTWEITLVGLGSGVRLSGRTLNHLKEDRDELEENYKMNSRPIAIALLESAKEGRLSLLRPRAEQ